jgi:hypothetical protein
VYSVEDFHKLRLAIAGFKSSGPAYGGLFVSEYEGLAAQWVEMRDALRGQTRLVVKANSRLRLAYALLSIPAILVVFSAILAILWHNLVSGIFVILSVSALSLYYSQVVEVSANKAKTRRQALRRDEGTLRTLGQRMEEAKHKKSVVDVAIERLSVGPDASSFRDVCVRVRSVLDKDNPFRRAVESYGINYGFLVDNNHEKRDALVDEARQLVAKEPSQGEYLAMYSRLLLVLPDMHPFWSKWNAYGERREWLLMARKGGLRNVGGVPTPEDVDEVI